MNRIVGSRELHVHEKYGELAGTVYGTPLITRREHSVFSQLGLYPKKVSGVVLDIGSGDDRLGMELHTVGADVDMHRVNAALSPDAPFEVSYAMREAIYELASRMKVPVETIFDQWHLHPNIFPDVTGLPVADWIFSLYCYPTIDIEHHVDGVGEPLDHRVSLEALSSLTHERTQLFLGPIPSDEHGQVFEAALAESPLGSRSVRRRHAVGQYLLHILPEKTDSSWL